MTESGSPGDDTATHSTPPGDSTPESGTIGDLESPCTLSTWHPDADGDGYGDSTTAVEACVQPEGWLADGTDCDDTDPDVHPGGAETLSDGVDSDCSGYDECGEGGVATSPRLSTNEDFATFCETYSQIEGYLFIINPDLETLAGLECLCAVSGRLFYGDPSSRPLDTYALRSLEGLENLGTIGGLSIQHAAALESLAGMASLHVTTLSEIEIYDAPLLTDIGPLAGVREVTGDVDIWWVASLTDLTPLTDTLETVGGAFAPSVDQALGTVPILTGVGTLSLVGPSSDASFPALARVGESLYIASTQTDFVPAQFPVLTEVGGYVAFLGLPSATTLPQAPNLETIGGSLYIHEVPLLEEVDAFGSLRQIGGDLVLEDCDGLTSLAGLETVESVGGCVDVDCAGIPAEEVDAFEAAIPYVGGTCLGELWEP